MVSLQDYFKGVEIGRCVGYEHGLDQGKYIGLQEGIEQGKKEEKERIIRLLSNCNNYNSILITIKLLEDGVL